MWKFIYTLGSKMCTKHVNRNYEIYCELLIMVTKMQCSKDFIDLLNTNII